MTTHGENTPIVLVAGEDSPEFAWEGKLAHVTDVINGLKPRYIESLLKTGWLFNNGVGRMPCLRRITGDKG